MNSSDSSRCAACGWTIGSAGGRHRATAAVARVTIQYMGATRSARARRKAAGEDGRARVAPHSTNPDMTKNTSTPAAPTAKSMCDHCRAWNSTTAMAAAARRIWIDARGFTPAI